MADMVVWSTPAMAMVPAADTVRDSKYVTTGGRVKFRPGSSGNITFIAGVSIPPGALPDGRIYLRAHVERTIPDLFGTVITLRKARRTDGRVSTILKCVGVQRGSQDNVRFTDSKEKRIKIDLDGFYYWVQVSIPTRSANSAVLGVSLVLIPD